MRLLSLTRSSIPLLAALALAVASVFEYANLLRGEATYEFSIVSEHGGPIASSQGFSVHSEPLAKEGYDTLIVGGDR